MRVSALGFWDLDSATTGPVALPPIAIASCGRSLSLSHERWPGVRVSGMRESRGREENGGWGLSKKNRA